MEDEQSKSREGLLLLMALALLGAACGSGDGSSKERQDDAASNGPTASGSVDRGGADGNRPGDRDDPSAPGAIGSSTSGGGSGAGAPAGSGSNGSRGGGSTPRGVVREDLIGDAGSLTTATSIANDASVFTLPRAAVAIGKQLAFVATDERVGARDREEVGARSAIFLQRDDGEPPRRLFVSADLVSPIDIDVSLDLRTLYVADFAGGKSGLGALAVASVLGGALGFVAEGFSPRGVTVGPSGEVFFSGKDPVSGAVGVFVLADGAVRALFTGPPLVDPSGIAAFADGRVLVADTRAFDGAVPLSNEASIVLIDDGQASLFASGFATGFPAGIALTEDESTLLVSAQSADRHDTLLLIDVAAPGAPPRAVTASFSTLQDSAGGLKRAHDKDEFIFASLAANAGGTVFRIE